MVRALLSGGADATLPNAQVRNLPPKQDAPLCGEVYTCEGFETNTWLNLNALGLSLEGPDEAFRFHHPMCQRTEEYDINYSYATSCTP